MARRYRQIGILMILVMIAVSACGAGAETLEAWTHEAGWIPFTLAVQQEELEATWEEAAKGFGELTGMQLDGPTLKSMTLQGYGYMPQMDHMDIDGSKITMTNKDGKVMFVHEYNWVETVEDVIETPVYIFKTEDADAAEYTYLCLTTPQVMETEAGKYLTFNLFNAKKNYRATFDIHAGANVEIPCSMIQADTGTEVLAQEVMNLFASSMAILH